MLPRILLWVLLLLSIASCADEPELLEPEKAFRFSARLLDANRVEIRFQIAPGYYMYRDKFEFSAEPAYLPFNTSQLPPGKIKKDEFFGEMQVYRGDMRFVLPLAGTGDTVSSLRLKAVSQGCADIGVCSPPQAQTAEIGLASLAPATSGPGVSPFLPPAATAPVPARQ